MNDDPAQLTDISQYLQNILTMAIPLIGILSFIMLLVGGFSILTSSGNSDNLKKGKSILGGAIGGLVLSILSYLVLVLIENITGAPVTEFKIGI